MNTIIHHLLSSTSEMRDKKSRISDVDFIWIALAFFCVIIDKLGFIAKNRHNFSHRLFFDFDVAFKSTLIIHVLLNSDAMKQR